MAQQKEKCKSTRENCGYLLKDSLTCRIDGDACTCIKVYPNRQLPLTYENMGRVDNALAHSRQPDFEDRVLNFYAALCKPLQIWVDCF